jgi:hypothetical protein
MPLRRQVSLPLKCFASTNVLSFQAFSASYLVILEPSCNNTISTLIMSLYDLYVHLLHSRFIENHPIWILEDRPLIFEVVL